MLIVVDLLMYIIKKDGWVNISHDDCFKLYQKYFPKKIKAINEVKGNDEEKDDEQKEDEDGDATMS